MTTATTKKYAAALDELEKLHRSGQIGANKYELHRQNLLAEAAKQHRRGGLWNRTITILGIVALVILGLLVLWGLGNQVGV